MENYLKVMLIGLVSGITGTGIGGLSAFLVRDISKRIMGLILEFSAGLMLAVVCFELIPEAFENGGVAVGITGLFAGVFTVVFLESLMRKASFMKGHHQSSLLHTGLLTALGIALHNLPEGFAVGSGFEVSTSLGLTLTAVILIHDIPEGIAMAVPMRAGGFSGSRAFGFTVLSGVPMGLGALIGALLGNISRLFIAGCLGFAGGAMLYIVFGGLVPESKRLYRGRLPSLGNIVGIVCGILVCVYS